MRSVLTGILLMAALTPIAHAQTDLDTSLFLARVVPTEPPPPAAAQPPAVRALTERWTAPEQAPPTPRPQLLLSLAYITNDANDVAQATAGAVWNTPRPVRATLSYARIDPSGDAERIDSYGGAVRWKVAATKTSGLTLLAAYSDNQGSSKKRQFGAATEFLVGGDVTAGINTLWTRSDKSHTSVDDVVAQGTVALNLDVVIIGIGYTLKNDLAHEDDVSAEVRVPTTAGEFSAAISKHKTLRFVWGRAFGKKS